jgi:hypothetical protein
MTRRIESLGQIGLPILANMLLAAILFSTISPSDRPRPSSAIAPPPPEPIVIAGDGARPLPNADLETLLASVRLASGHEYRCEGPWQTSDGLLNWSCRTEQSLVGLRGQTRHAVSAIEVTWFGFDTASTDLPIWAESTQQSDSDRAQSAQWVQANLGSPSQGRVGSVDFHAGGARGAITLYIAGS